MKVVKKILIGLLIFFVVLIAAAMILPSIFKDDIKAAIDKAVAENVNADVVFDVNNFSLSAFRHFPNITAEIKDLGVFNREPFKDEHLFVVNRLEIEINPMDVLFGDKMRLKGITMVKPQISIKVLPDGRANYDIAMPSKDTVKTTEQPSKFSFGIDHWEVVDGDVTYDDKSIPYFLTLKGLNHTGSGDFTQDQFDLRTHSKVDTVSTAMGAMEFLTNKRAEIDAVISISENISKFTFKENKAKINDFAMSFDGWFKMNPNSYDMDITFKSPENTFKSLLSIIPGMYTKDFKNIETKGDLQFAGFAKGTYSEKQMPAFNLDFKVKDAMFKYPDLPTAVNNINMDLLVDNKDGKIGNTLVDLKKLHLDFGSNPVDASVRIENLRDYRMNGNLNAKLNLAELSKMFPMEGLEMKGAYSITAKAQGIYDSLRKIVPTMDVSMALTDGYVKSSKVPMPLQDLKMSATVKNTSGKMAETVIAVNNFTMMLDGERLTADMVIQNLDDYTWDIKANGGVDLEKITKIFPLEGTTVAGKVKANLETKGKMSDVNAKRYDRLPTTGSASLRDFKYVAKGMPAVSLAAADATFNPQKIELSRLDGTVGKSDFSVTGTVTNYIAYVVNNDVIRGTVKFNSKLFDLNEFMKDSGTTPTKEDTTSFGVIAIPRNIDFTLKSSLSTVKMMDFTITNASGDIILKDGIANLSGLRFDLLGGTFGINGAYNPKDLKKPRYDLDVKIDHMSIQEAARSFSLVKTYAPIAGMVSGNFSSDFKINGLLTKKMMPNPSTVNMNGTIKIPDAKLTQSKLMANIAALTKLGNAEELYLKNVNLLATITNGRLSVKPFDVKLGDYSTTVSGSSGLDQSIDYSMKMLVPAGALGAQLNSFLNPGAKATDKIPVTIGIGGTFSDPKTSLVSADQKKVLDQMAEEKKQEALKQLSEGKKPEEVLKNILSGKKDTTGARTDTTKVKKDSVATDPAKDLLQNKLQNLLKKKKNN
jgi:uncharacterized protein involved in outer membrane biogenesis